MRGDDEMMMIRENSVLRLRKFGHSYTFLATKYVILFNDIQMLFALKACIRMPGPRARPRTKLTL